MQADQSASEPSGMPTGDANHVPTRNRWRPVLGIVTAGVVVYFALMAATLFGVALDLVRADDTESRIWHAYSYRNTPDEPWRHGFGLTFAGWGGVAWALALGAIILCSLGGGVMRQGLIRRFSLLALLAVATLWACNAVWMSIVGDFEHFGASAALRLAGFAGAAIVAWRRWPKTPRGD